MAAHAQSFPEKFQSTLDAGHLADAAKLAQSAVDQDPNDASARFALGISQALRAFEIGSQAMYRHGVDGKIARTANLPLLRSDTPQNPQVDPLTYEAYRQALKDVLQQLNQAEKTLEGVTDPAVKLPLRLDTIRLDLTGDGKTQPASLALIFGLATSTTDEPTTQTAEPFEVHLDAGDVYWLRGYCHLLAGLEECLLAYDEHEVFNTSAHIFFENPKTPYPFLKHSETANVDFPSIIDVVAFFHQIRLNPIEPQRLLAAREHFKAMLSCGRESWKAIFAETDDDHEWIPNPRQKPPVATLAITQEQIDAWLKFVDEADRLLDGKVLLPFWRGDDETVGVNLAKVFQEPKPFDLILWLQGPAAQPYLEKGPITDKNVYANLQRTFEGNLFLYALWFN